MVSSVSISVVSSAVVGCNVLVVGGFVILICHHSSRLVELSCLIVPDV